MFERRIERLRRAARRAYVPSSSPPPPSPTPSAASTSEEVEVYGLSVGIKLIANPQEHLVRVSERLHINRGDVVRAITLTIRIPAGLPHHQKVELPLPISTPRKGALASITGANVNNIAALGHSHLDHAQLAKAMLSYSLQLSTAYWRLVEPERCDIFVRRAEAALHRMVDAEPAQAERILGARFLSGGRLRGNRLPGEVTVEESETFKLCRVLATRNIVIARVHAMPGELVRVAYNSRHPRVAQHYARPKAIYRFLRDVLGVLPPNSAFAIPLARHTDDYDLHITAPPGHFFAKRQVYEVSADNRSTTPLPTLSHSRDALTGAAVQFSRGASDESQILVVKGSESLSRLQTSFVTYEIPLGSIAAAWVSAFISTFTLGTLLLARYGSTGAVQASDVPTLLALLASGIAIAGTLFYRENLSEASFLSKVVLMLCSAISTVFAVWWVYASGGHHAHHDSIEAIAARRGGAALFWADVLLLLTCSFRALNLMSAYSRVRNGHEPLRLKELGGIIRVKEGI